MDKIILIDGNSLSYRAFYAMPALKNKKGLYTNSVYGFTLMLEKILADKESGLEDIRVDLKENSVENEKLNRLISNSNKLMEKFKEDNFDFAK